RGAFPHPAADRPSRAVLQLQLLFRQQRRRRRPAATAAGSGRNPCPAAPPLERGHLFAESDFLATDLALVGVGRWMSLAFPRSVHFWRTTKAATCFRGSPDTSRCLGRPRWITTASLTRLGKPMSGSIRVPAIRRIHSLR